MRGRLVLVALALLVTACTTSGEPSPPPAPAVVVPSAVPAGAVYGRLLDGSGKSVPGGAVTLTQPFDDNIVLLSGRLISLGVFCLIPDAGLCPTSHRADLTDNGLWSVPAGDVEEGKALTLGGQRPGTSTGTGALTTVSVPNGPDPQRVPDLVLWEPEVTLTPVARGTRVTWPRLTGPRGRKARYAVYVTTGEPAFAKPVEVASGLRRTSAVVAGWVTEDQPMRVTVIASTKRGRAVFVHTSPSVAATGTAVPVSRGRPCSADKGGRQVRAVGTCGLTDGDLSSHVQVRLKGECDVDTSGCRPRSHHRICVDLGRARPVSRVVVRTPFLAVDQVVELSRDGRTFTTQGRLGDVGADDARVFAVPVRPAATARFACIRSDAYGYAGATTAEISVW
ncbi:MULTISPECIES: hypothetical protein [unclassified Nocardioides]|uniref:hypothetical protein n=1 Tax=unclassified Nocardioides TaxID=2615069 RepID=UPI00070128F6|nr:MULTISPECIES: hypothetical protein [unclassified Nocardioides]KRA29793.1 hypothetical protein ASD81_18925 [Nocardioides sp. Root614]KRA86717.1 hypothetical protein ASD84_21150 [Nocardioides sp. Root682]